MTGEDWYVCQTKPRQEARAVLKLTEQGYEVYLPMLSHWQRKKGAWIKTELAMFPRYGFVRCTREGQSIAPIRNTPGLLGLIRFGNIPATLSDTTVAAIRNVEEQSARAREEKIQPFSIGMQVTVADGPLKGLTGLVSEVADERIAVLLTLLGQEKPIAIPANHLSAVDPLNLEP